MTHRPHHWINQNGRCDNGQMMDQGDDWKPVYLHPPKAATTEADWDALAKAYHSERGWYAVKDAVVDMLPAAAPTPVSYAIEVLYNAGSMSEHWQVYRDEFEQSEDREDADRERALLIEDGFPAEHVRVVGLVIV